MLAKGTISQKDDPLNRISNYQYVAADKEADTSFATADTRRFKLAGQDDRAQQNEVGPPRAEGEKPKAQPRRVEKAVGANDPCPCGSGKKFKNCHGARTPEAKT